MARRIYSDYDQALVAVTLQTNEGNIRKTARETGIPVTTVRDWKVKWDIEGYPETLQEVIAATTESFIDAAKNIRLLMIERLKGKVEKDQASARDLITGIGIFTDKINVLSGIATSRTETVQVALPDAKELAKELAQFVDKTVEAAYERHDVIDAEWAEINKGELTSGASR